MVIQATLLLNHWTALEIKSHKAVKKGNFDGGEEDPLKVIELLGTENDCFISL
jgi:hypothetical protein